MQTKAYPASRQPHGIASMPRCVRQVYRRAFDVSDGKAHPSDEGFRYGGVLIDRDDKQSRSKEEQGIKDKVPSTRCSSRTADSAIV